MAESQPSMLVVEGSSPFIRFRGVKTEGDGA